MNTDLTLSPVSELVGDLQAKYQRIPFTSGSIGEKPDFKWLQVKLLYISTKYQRLVSLNTLKKAKTFNYEYCQPIVVYLRPDGTHVVVDGQHKSIMGYLAQGDTFEVPCVVYKHPKERSVAECTKIEAQMFDALNTSRKNTSKLDKVRAGLAYGDPEAKAFEDKFVTMGVQTEGIGDLSGCEIKGFIKAEVAYDKWGSRAAKQAVTYLKDVYKKHWEKDVIDGSMIAGVAAIFNLIDALGAAKKGSGLTEFVTDWLHKTKLKTWVDNTAGPSEIIIPRRMVERYNALVEQGVINGATIGEVTLENNGLPRLDKFNA